MLFEQNIASNITRDKEPKHLKYYILNNSTYLQIAGSEKLCKLYRPKTKEKRKFRKSLKKY